MNRILEYQRLDIELNKLKKSNLNNEDKANMAKFKGYFGDSQNKAFALENDAKKLIQEYTNLKKQYEQNFEKVQKLTNTNLDNVSLEDVDGILSNINSLSSELFLLERNINIIITKIKNSLKDFEATKNNIIKAKQKYNEYKAKYEQGIKNVEPKIKEIEEKMKGIEKEIEPDVLAKYKAVKADKIFPVYVFYNEGHCSGCRVEIPTNKINKLKTEGKIVCEQCHRIIINK